MEASALERLSKDELIVLITRQQEEQKKAKDKIEELEAAHARTRSTMERLSHQLERLEGNRASALSSPLLSIFHCNQYVE